MTRGNKVNRLILFTSLLLILVIIIGLFPTANAQQYTTQTYPNKIVVYGKITVNGQVPPGFESPVTGSRNFTVAVGNFGFFNLTRGKDNNPNWDGIIGGTGHSFIDPSGNYWAEIQPGDTFIPMIYLYGREPDPEHPGYYFLNIIYLSLVDSNSDIMLVFNADVSGRYDIDITAHQVSSSEMQADTVHLIKTPDPVVNTPTPSPVITPLPPSAPTIIPSSVITVASLPLNLSNVSAIGVNYPTQEKAVSTLAPVAIGVAIGGFWPYIVKLFGFIYDGIKSYLQRQFSAKEAKYRKVTAKVRQPWLFGLSLEELIIGIDCTLLIGIAFAYAKNSLFFIDQLIMIISLAGMTIVVSELVRRYFAARYKADSEYKFWGIGAITLIVTALLHQPFSRPARTIINKSGELDAKKQVIIAIAPCVASILFSIVFLLLMAYGNGYENIGKEGFKMAMMLSVYSLMPFEPMDGKRVIGWNKLVWGIVFIPTLLFYLGMLLFIL